MCKRNFKNVAEKLAVLLVAAIMCASVTLASAGELEQAADASATGIGYNAGISELTDGDGTYETAPHPQKAENTE